MASLTRPGRFLPSCAELLSSFVVMGFWMKPSSTVTPNPQNGAETLTLLIRLRRSSHSFKTFSEYIYIHKYITNKSNIFKIFSFNQLTFQASTFDNRIKLMKLRLGLTLGIVHYLLINKHIRCALCGNNAL